MVHFSPYHVLPEGVAVFLIKLYGSIGILCNLDTILVFDVVYLSMSRKDIGHTKNFLGFLLRHLPHF